VNVLVSGDSDCATSGWASSMVVCISVQLVFAMANTVSIRKKARRSESSHTHATLNRLTILTLP